MAIPAIPASPASPARSPTVPLLHRGGPCRAPAAGEQRRRQRRRRPHKEVFMSRLWSAHSGCFVRGGTGTGRPDTHLRRLLCVRREGLCRGSVSFTCCPQRPLSPFQPPAAGGSPCAGVWPCWWRQGVAQRRVRGDAAPLLSSLPTLLGSGAGEQLERSASCGFVQLLPGREVSWLQGSVVPGRRPLLAWCQGAPTALPWHLPKGMVTSLGLSSPSPSPAWHGCPPWPLGLVALGGTWTLRDPGWA